MSNPKNQARPCVLLGIRDHLILLDAISGHLGHRMQVSCYGELHILGNISIECLDCGETLVASKNFQEGAMCETVTREERTGALCAASVRVCELADQMDALIGEVGKISLQTNYQKQEVKERANKILLEMRDFSLFLGNHV